MKLKDTLHMPNTSFNMKASLATREPVFQKEWEEKDEALMSKRHYYHHNDKIVKIPAFQYRFRG